MFIFLIRWVAQPPTSGWFRYRILPLWPYPRWPCLTAPSWGKRNDPWSACGLRPRANIGWCGASWIWDVSCFVLLWGCFVFCIVVDLTLNFDLGCFVFCIWMHLTLHNECFLNYIWFFVVVCHAVCLAKKRNHQNMWSPLSALSQGDGRC